MDEDELRRGENKRLKRADGDVVVVFLVFVVRAGGKRLAE